MLSLAGAADVLPPPPKQYFNDYAKVVAPATVQELNTKLEEFERANSTQILVVLFPKLPEGAAMEDWTIRTFQHWKAGQKGKDNGAIFFVFVRDRKMRIEVGYGLEGALPDATANQILADTVRPRLQRNDWDGAMRAAVNAMIQAVRGEYRGAGRTAADRPGARGSNSLVPFIIFAIFFLSFLAALRRGRGTVYRPYGRSSWGGWTGGGRGGGGWSGGGGGGFSGGGGRSGGGGASGSW